MLSSFFFLDVSVDCLTIGWYKDKFPKNLGVVAVMSAA